MAFPYAAKDTRHLPSKICEKELLQNHYDTLMKVQAHCVTVISEEIETKKREKKWKKAIMISFEILSGH